MAKTDQLQIVYRDVNTLKAYERNARMHSAGQIAAIQELMRRFGWTNPILLDGKNGVVAGHGRIIAAMGLWENGEKIRRTPKPMMAPTIDIAGLSAADKRALIIADNASAELASWDDRIRAAELIALREAGLQLPDMAALTAIPEVDIESILAALERNAIPPEQFRSVDMNIETHYRCPSCGYEWSGSTGKDDDE